MNRNINWDSSTRNNVYYAGESGFLTSQIWMNDLEDDIQASGVEIIELKSADNSLSSSDDPEPRASHPWSYAGGWRDLEETRNRQDRLRAHLRNLNRVRDNDAYFNNSECPTPDTAEIETFQQTCFSILDKLSALKLDSSSDSEESSNEVRCDDILLEQEWNGGEPSGEMLAYSSELDGEKRTVWIYSFNKNSHVLSDHDYELVNIPSQDSVACSNYSSENEEQNKTPSRRVSSPIPAMHIPRLDLSLGATLPNVTEVTEPKSLESLKGKKYVPITKKPANNWCSDNSAKLAESKSSNVVNWMALSPREKQESRHHFDVIPLEPVIEVPQDEKKQQLQLFGNGLPEPTSFNQEQPNLNPFETQDKNDISTSTPPPHSQRTPTGANSEQLENKTYLITSSTQRQHVDFPYNVGDIAELPTVDAVRTLFDRGDCQAQKIANPFLLSPKSDPTQNLDSNSLTKQKHFHCDRKCLSAGDSMIRNLPAFTPGEWTAYFPITGSRLSVVLPVEPNRANQTLLQRCFSCFKCCK